MQASQLQIRTTGPPLLIPIGKYSNVSATAPKAEYASINEVNAVSTDSNLAGSRTS